MCYAHAIERHRMRCPFPLRKGAGGGEKQCAACSARKRRRRPEASTARANFSSLPSFCLLPIRQRPIRTAKDFDRLIALREFRQQLQLRGIELYS